MDPWVYVVLLGISVIAYSWMRPKSTSVDASEGIITTLDQFVQDMSDENQKILNQLAKQKEDWMREKQDLIERIHRLETKMAEWKNNPKMEVLSSDKPLETAETNDQFRLQERYQELFNLYAKGKSVPYIAKKTGMNHGEIELILQLSKQGGRHA